MPADARREPPSDAGHGGGRPPDGPPDEEPWGFARGFRSLFLWIRDPNGFCRSLVSRNPVADPVGMLRHAEMDLDARLAKASTVGILRACTVHR